MRPDSKRCEHILTEISKLAAGMDGIEEKEKPLETPKSQDLDLQHADEDERDEVKAMISGDKGSSSKTPDPPNVHRLPQTLRAAMSLT